MSVRARAVIVDDEGRVLLDTTAHKDREPFFWLPGGGVEPGETSEEALHREMIEEASLQIEVGRLVYVSENLFVESGDYRHEVILYRLATIVGKLDEPPSDPREHGWYRPSEVPGRGLHPPDVARALEIDIAEGFTRPVQHLVTDERPG
jgi:ADP-ribose pyrophosphatase YjhB (NUDIX family)